MSEKLLAYALTTEARVKDRLTITGANFDPLIQRLINGVTEFIERSCNRRFKETVYMNEVYSVISPRQEFLVLKQAPASAVTSLQYRAGTPSNPNWTGFIADQFELYEDGDSGILKVYGGIPKGTNSIRVSYTAGYKFNFANAGDAGDATPTHTLPYEISELAERLVIKAFKKRESVGKSQEGFEGSNVNWQKEMDDDEKEILLRHVRIAKFI